MILVGVAVHHSVFSRAGFDGEDVPSCSPMAVEMVGECGVEGVVVGGACVCLDVGVDERPDLCEVGTAHVSVTLPRYLSSADEEDQEERRKTAFMLSHKQL